MPCGGIYPIRGADGGPVVVEHMCWECRRPWPDCFVEEWDAYIHSECVEAFLAGEEGQIVLSHGHGVYIWKGEEVVELHAEKDSG